jgi:flagellar hook-length control protein FliK
MSTSSAPSAASIQSNAATADWQAAVASFHGPAVPGGVATEKNSTSKKTAESLVDFQALFLAVLQLQTPPGSMPQPSEWNGTSQAAAPDAAQAAAINSQGNQQANHDQESDNTKEAPLTDATGPSLPGELLRLTTNLPGSSQVAEAAPLPCVCPAAPAVEATLSPSQAFSSAKESAGTKTRKQGLPGLGAPASRVDPLTTWFGSAPDDVKSGNAAEDNHNLPRLFNLGAAPADLSGSALDLRIVARKKSPELSETRNPAGQSTLKESSVQVRYASSEIPLETRASPSLPDSHPSNSGSAVSGQIASGIIARAEIVTREGQTDFHLRLEPPELGAIRVHLSANDQGISARLVVHEEVAKQLIESQLESLRQRLTNAGISLGSFDVSHGGPGSQDARKQRDPSAVVTAVGPGLSRPKQQLSQLAATLASTYRIDLVV